MNLLDFPDLILELIATYLDTESLIAFRKADMLLLYASINSAKHVKMTKRSISVSRFISEYGSEVRSLDLTNYPWQYSRSTVWDPQDKIIECPYLTELSLLNSGLPLNVLLMILDRLHHLKTLSYTLLDHPVNLDDRGFGRFNSIENIYLETSPRHRKAQVVIALLNACNSIKVVHINLLGPSRPNQDPVPELRAERWKTLHTFICSCYLSTTQDWEKSFLKSIFHHKNSAEIRDWINQDKKCYIYERGKLNRFASNGFVANDNVKYLKRYRCVSLSNITSDNRISNSLWKSVQSVQSLRISNPPEYSGTRFDIRDFIYSLSSTLTQLDLSDCHSDCLKKNRSHLFSSLKSLGVLAIPLCLFLLPEESDSLSAEECEESIPTNALKQVFTKSLQSLRLKKLYLKGSCHQPYCTQQTALRRVGPAVPECYCPCQGCTKSLTETNLPMLKDFLYLDEVTFDSVYLKNSAYHNLGSPKPRTVRLCLNEKSAYLGLRNFIRQCANLRNFKIESLDLPLHSKYFWVALDEGKHFKQLCLATELDVSSPEIVMREILPRILRRLDSLHIHGSQLNFTEYSQSLLKSFRPCELDEKITFFKNLRLQDITKHFKERFSGRSLCHPESFIGVVEPVGWDIE